MAHRLLVPPVRRMEGQARLPVIQDLEANTRAWHSTLRVRDSLRLARTSGTMTALGPLPAVQRFAVDPAGGVNSPESMQPGLRIANARRLVDKTRGQSAGMQ